MKEKPNHSVKYEMFKICLFILLVTKYLLSIYYVQHAAAVKRPGSRARLPKLGSQSQNLLVYDLGKAITISELLFSLL